MKAHLLISWENFPTKEKGNNFREFHRQVRAMGLKIYKRPEGIRIYCDNPTTQAKLSELMDFLRKSELVWTEEVGTEPESAPEKDEVVVKKAPSSREKSSYKVVYIKHLIEFHDKVKRQAELVLYTTERILPAVGWQIQMSDTTVAEEKVTDVVWHRKKKLLQILLDDQVMDDPLETQIMDHVNNGWEGCEIHQEGVPMQ